MRIYPIILALLLISCEATQDKASVQKTSRLEVEKGQNGNDTITLGGGCYWCVEAVYELMDGVVDVSAGFTGGHRKNPSYEEVCMGTTGHTEVAQIIFDSTQTSVQDILKVFFTVHDPTTINRQGNDVGTQYRSAIYYHSIKQKEIAQTIIRELNESKAYSSEIVTEVAPLTIFYRAKEDHQDYYENNSEDAYCRMVIQPKIEKFEKVFKKYK
ncbi:MAG: peptide-methionine (S)-S-oxide reductase MsrA [Crocinitomicaceae bacterium]|jgi:peptide-methionine (S)-S-oxide reductase|nr:peptide-methionine (S)-S-oxide reductase MsrA [Crocinitomicaceae bacterium]MDP4797395.1 peptide-methionine (S)-S-oxide reductase MsrA [Crocinitomicaceae bacterium]MDP4865610.1 peptide-methionine (S)-S-oxide reductase MsrA [Crocinitomicaceae bacterium]MDP5010198.1 peptide-methionine (S)-S-oxide reductase MsrA [Crocinitomicaceae bacterium]